MQPFEAEVGRVLDLVINSLYTHREIFLRELVSNASDALDKLRYESLSQPELLGEHPDLEVRLIVDKAAGTLTIADDGIGMSHDELAENLGTIARSGTARFLENVSGDTKNDTQLIGRFGVGFYSVFMVADEVAVISRRAGSDHTWTWRSDGRTGYTLGDGDREIERGTVVVLKLKDDAKEFLEGNRIRHLVRTYSDHVAFPINLVESPAPAEEGEETPSEPAPEQINAANALWRRPKSEITDEQYTEFYHHVAHAFDEPLSRLHFSVEGALSYTGLLFVPSQAPFDLYDPQRRNGVKLYVRRVFITDQLDDLLPRYLRFVSGIVDSEDLQLNVSRESLQNNAVMARIKKGLVKRLLDELQRLAGEAAPEGETETPYEKFWSAFGAVLKEGLYEDQENRERLFELARFKSTNGDGWVSLKDYVGRMQDGQDAILTISGENETALKSSPQLEQARAKGVEVLLLTDQIDDFWLPMAGAFDGKPFKSLTRDNVDLSAIGADANEGDEPEAPEEANADVDRLLARMKIALGDAVADVRVSKRLTDSAVCLVAAENAMDMRFERFLKQHNQVGQLSQRVLEVNPKHALIAEMASRSGDEAAAADLDELAGLLLDQARVVEGEPLPNPGEFSRRMSKFLSRALG